MKSKEDIDTDLLREWVLTGVAHLADLGASGSVLQGSDSENAEMSTVHLVVMLPTPAAEKLVDVLQKLLEGIAVSGEGTPYRPTKLDS